MKKNKYLQKAIGDFIYKEKVKFFIPFYQRGYKWEKEHIEALLNDLWDFHRKLKKREKGYKYYSLQPLVVKTDNDKSKKDINYYKVVDGQQRLTTIYLILFVIEDILNEKIEKFSLEYEREGSEEFLRNIKNKSKEDAKKNIDFYYMYNGYKIIKEWFEKNNITPSNLRKFRDFILTDSDYEDGKDLNENVRFIWYKIDKKENEFDVFIRLNIGKIPLTNAELIKSYLLQSIKNKDYRREISNEWDNIEYTLADNEFFGFLSNKNYHTRIELLFQILLGLSSYKNYELYEKFLSEFSDENKVLQSWKNLKNIFYTLKFWYEDREFYHLIGYLVSSGKSIVEIYKVYEASENKDDFKIKLKEIIKDTLVSGEDINKFIVEIIPELSYSNSNDKKLLTKIFLLFNILTLINSSKDSYIKFSFYKFNNEKWSIEHITPQTEKKYFKMIKNELEKIKDKLNNDSLNNILSKDKLEEDDIKKIEDIFSDEKISLDKDNIRNLTLLSFKDNASLKNNFFPVKRNMIVEMDKNGAFVPIVTKNLFLKYYSTIGGNPEKWTFEDGEHYVKALQKEFEKFFLGEKSE